MDFLIQELKALNKHLELVTKLLHEQVKATQENTDAQTKSANTPPVLLAELQIPDSIVRQINTETTEKRTRENFKVWVETGTLLIVLIYTIATGYIVWEMDKQNVNQSSAILSQGATADRSLNYTRTQIQQAQTQFGISQKEFQMEQRPQMAVVSYVMFDPQRKLLAQPTVGRPFAVNLIIKNVGKSSAINVAIHRHVLFGERAANELRVELPDQSTSGYAMEAGTDTVTTAYSLKDTFANESAYHAAEDELAWDGTFPIIVFGRISYYDSFGIFYCTPYAATYYLDSNMWGLATTFAKSKVRKVSELCPTGKR